MSKCPYCGETILMLYSELVRSQGMGDAPYEIPVLLIRCSSCNKVLGVLHPPKPER